MERLTIPDVRVDEHTTRRTMIDVEAVREHAMDFYWRLKAYEDTRLMPDEIEKLRGQNEQLREAAALVAKESAELLERRWIPVEERLPKYGVKVLATDMYEEDDCIGIWTREEYKDDADGCWYDDHGWWHASDDVTHWMSLPKAPEVKKALEAMKNGNG